MSSRRTRSTSSATSPMRSSGAWPTPRADRGPRAPTAGVGRRAAVGPRAHRRRARPAGQERLAAGLDPIDADDRARRVRSGAGQHDGPRPAAAATSTIPTCRTSTYRGCESTWLKLRDGTPSPGARRWWTATTSSSELVRLVAARLGRTRAALRRRHARAQLPAARRLPAVRRDGRLDPPEPRDPQAPLLAVVAGRAPRPRAARRPTCGRSSPRRCGPAPQHHRHRRHRHRQDDVAARPDQRGARRSSGSSRSRTPTSSALDRFVDLHPDHDALQARPANIEGRGEVTMLDLARMALRMDPDRVIVGEVRGGEAFPMLLAMSQGNNGSMCTMHADSSRSVFPKLAAYVSMADIALPVETVNLLDRHGRALRRPHRGGRRCAAGRQRPRGRRRRRRPGSCRTRCSHQDPTASPCLPTPCAATTQALLEANGFDR